MENPILASDMYGQVGLDSSNGNIENFYQSMLNEQRNLNVLQMQREDTAYQRMVADMKKAGLNPWTGVSSGGSTSSSLSSPHQSALNGLVQLLDVHNSAISNRDKNTISGISTGARIALGIIGGLFGL